MRMANEMYKYVKDNKYIDNVGKARAKKHFESLEKELHGDEVVDMTLVGLLENNGIADGYYAVAITNRRIVMAQSGLFGRNKSKTVLLDNLNDITITQKLSMRHIEIDTISDRIVLSLNTWSNESVGHKLKETVLKFKQRETEPTGGSLADELRKFKELFDDGIITEEEFETKKKELL